MGGRCILNYCLAIRKYIFIYCELQYEYSFMSHNRFPLVCLCVSSVWKVNMFTFAHSNCKLTQ